MGNCRMYAFAAISCFLVMFSRPVEAAWEQVLLTPTQGGTYSVQPAGQSQFSDKCTNSQGEWVINQDDGQAYLMSGGQATALGSFGSGRSTWARAINDHSRVVGMAYNGWNWRGFIWDAVDGMRDLGTLGGTWSGGGIDINERDQVVGMGYTGTRDEGFIWEAGVITNLNTLGGTGGSRAFAINNQGQVVGDWFPSVWGGESYGYVWQNGTMAKLIDLLAPDSQEWTISTATDINDDGSILAWGNIVPEPSSLSLMLLAVVAATRIRR